MYRILCLLTLLTLAACGGERAKAPLLSVAETLGGASPADTRGFARATAPQDFVFPRDHFSHPDFRNEWWYLTGNLATDDGREFGYQLTFFRIALAPEGAVRARDSAWATRQVWMAHAAVTDISEGSHVHEQRLARGAAGLAGNTAAPFRLWLDDWRITGGNDVFPWHINTPGQDFTIDLTLAPSRDIVLQGEAGLSQKSAAIGNASYYYSITRLATSGSIQLGGQVYSVRGQSWLDREWSTSALGPEQAGWDWFSLQLDSGEDIMFYRLRRKNGGMDPFSSGTWLEPGGDRIPLAADGVELSALEHWEAPNGAQYPVRWRMRTENPPREWIIAAAVEDQLMETVVHYWEGAVDVLDPQSGERVGRGYLEMTGYGQH